MIPPSILRSSARGRQCTEPGPLAAMLRRREIGKQFAVCGHQWTILDPNEAGVGAWSWWCTTSVKVTSWTPTDPSSSLKIPIQQCSRRHSGVRPSADDRCNRVALGLGRAPSDWNRGIELGVAVVRAAPNNVRGHAIACLRRFHFSSFHLIPLAENTHWTTYGP